MRTLRRSSRRYHNSIRYYVLVHVRSELSYHVSKVIHFQFVAQTFGVVCVDILQVTLPDVETVHLFLLGCILLVVLLLPFQPLGRRSSGGQCNTNGGDKKLHVLSASLTWDAVNVFAFGWYLKACSHETESQGSASHRCDSWQVPRRGALDCT